MVTLCFTQVRTGEVNRGIFYQEGIASWYGREFNGRSTASGEIFNDSQFTAAHPILPFGTMLKVTNQHNNKTVTVRINDRGPFVAARIIDLSRAAAEQLDMITTGTAPVKVESLSEVSLPAKSGQVIQVQPASAEPYSNPENASVRAQEVNQGHQPVVHNQNQGQQTTHTETVQPWVETGAVRLQPGITGKYYKVQVGAYKHPEYAVDAFEKLKRAGLNPAYERFGDYFRVVLTGIKQEELGTVSEKLRIVGFKEVLLREEL